MHPNSLFVMQYSRRIRAAFMLAATTLVALVFAQSASAALGDLAIVSRADGQSAAPGDGTSYANQRTTSADGRYVVFISYASGFGGAPTTDRSVYRRDTLLGRTELVSRADGVAGAPGDDSSFAASVSADGNRIAFASGADNLDSVSNDNYTDIFVRDMAAATTTLVSRGSIGAPYNNGQAAASSLSPRISGDGSVVAFTSLAQNLDGTVTDNNGFGDTYVRDLAAQTTRLVSKSTGGTIGNGLSGPGDVSFDGRFVAIDSEADNLGGTIGSGSQVYLRDRVANTLTLLSQPTGGSNIGGNDSSGASTITDSGDAVAFISRASDLVPGTPANRYLGYLRNIATGTTSVITRSSSGEIPNDDVENAVLAVDGSAVNFTTAATNIEPPAGTGAQSFFTSLANGQTQLVSRVGRDGAAANQPVQDTTLGRTKGQVFFATAATNLSPEATNSIQQLYTRDALVVDPVSQVAVVGKRFTAKLSRSRFAVKFQTTNGPTAISGSATIRVSRKIARSGRIVVKYKLRSIPADRSSHKLTFKLSKKQNRLARKALRTKRSRLRVTITLVASKPGSQGTGRFSGKLRR